MSVLKGISDGTVSVYEEDFRFFFGFPSSRYTFLLLSTHSVLENIVSDTERP